MLVHSRTEPVARCRRVGHGLEETHGVRPAESHGFVPFDGLLRVFQGTGDNEAADGLPLNGSRLFDPPPWPLR